MKGTILIIGLLTVLLGACVGREFSAKSPEEDVFKNSLSNSVEQAKRQFSDAKNAMQAAKEQDQEKMKNFACFCTSAKIEALAKKARQNPEFEYEDHILDLSDADFNKFSVREKFIFAVTCPEGYTQTCAMANEHRNIDQNLFKSIPRVMEGKIISERQVEALKKNRDSTIFYLNQCMANSTAIPNEYRELILKLKAVECIPAVVNLIENSPKTDTYLLTVLMQLMKQGKYAPFQETDLYKTLYPKKYSPTYFVPLTEDRKKLIIEHALEFFKRNTEIIVLN